MRKNDFFRCEKNCADKWELVCTCKASSTLKLFGNMTPAPPRQSSAPPAHFHRKTNTKAVLVEAFQDGGRKKKEAKRRDRESICRLRHIVCGTCRRLRPIEATVNSAGAQQQRRRSIRAGLSALAAKRTALNLHNPPARTTKLRMAGHMRASLRSITALGKCRTRLQSEPQ